MKTLFPFDLWKKAHPVENNRSPYTSHFKKVWVPRCSKGTYNQKRRHDQDGNRQQDIKPDAIQDIKNVLEYFHEASNLAN